MLAYGRFPPGHSALLTNIWEVLEDRALHGQLVEICVQKGDDSLRRLRGVILNHFSS